MPDNVKSGKTMKVNWWRKLTLDDIVVTFAFFVGLIGGLLIGIIFPKVEPIFVAVFFGIGISALVYRFLGGISEVTSFTIIKGIKLTGSLAAIIACIYIISNELQKQRGCIRAEKLVLSFYKGSHPMTQNIKVKPVSLAEAIPVKQDGNVELSLEDIKASDGNIIINYQWPVEKGGSKDDICVTYFQNPPKIRLHFDFFDEMTKKGFYSKDINLTFREGITLQRESGFIMLDDNGEPIPEKNGEFFVPLNFKNGGGITIGRKEQLRPVIKIIDLEYKVDPPQIKILIAKDLKDYLGLTEGQRKKLEEIVKNR